MSFLYELIGRTWVAYARIRYRRQIRLTAAVAVIAATAAAYLLATRRPEEG